MTKKTIEQLYEELRQIIDGGSESFTHEDAVQYLKDKLAQPKYEPVAQPRFNCWSTNDGDSWFEHPADADVIYNTLGDEPKVGDEFEIIAGWRSVAAKYRVTEVNGDGDCEVECISHPQENTTTPQRQSLTDEMVTAAARVLNERQADACGVDRDDQWAIYSDDFKADARAMLEAAHGIKE